MVERRRFPRFPADVEVALAFEDGHTEPAPDDPGWAMEFQHRVHDISAGGMFVPWKNPLPPLRSRVRIRVRSRKVTAELTGEVVWQNPETGGGRPPGFGVQFVDLKPDQIQRMQDLLDGLEPEDVTREDVRPPDSLPAEHPRILVMEDDDAVRVFVTTILSRLPARVVVAKDGEEAMKLVDRGELDLCVLDYLVPKADGFQVARHIRSRSEVPILIMTAVLPKQALPATGLDTVTDAFLTKPFTAGKLRAAVQRLLRKKK